MSYITQREFNKISAVMDIITERLPNCNVGLKSQDGGWLFSVYINDTDMCYPIWHSPRYISELTAEQIAEGIITKVTYSYTE